MPNAQLPYAQRDVNQHIAPILALEILDMWKDEPQQRRSLAYALNREEWR